MTSIASFSAPITRTSLADSVYESVLEAIVSGALAAGAELNEVALARTLEVSRTPVHEAVRRLVADGLLEDSGRRLRVTSFTRGEMVEIYEMRKLLEGAAAELAAVNIAADVVAELRDATNVLFASRDAIDWNGRALAFDLRFHDALARGSGNERLYRDISRYRLLVRGLCRITGSQENLRQALAEHEQILAAIEAREPLAARERMQAHIAARLEGVLNAMPA